MHKTKKRVSADCCALMEKCNVEVENENAEFSGKYTPLNEALKGAPALFVFFCFSFSLFKETVKKRATMYLCSLFYIVIKRHCLESL